mmetsp:Transcript_44741/g.128392  ORF Transcript_44741/g.128392 Transcript_44741/m.128392 type:complete len:81 (+) Transcript_44741:132-374(+)
MLPSVVEIVVGAIVIIAGPVLADVGAIVGAAVFGGCEVVSVVAGGGGIWNRDLHCVVGDVACIVASSSTDLKLSPMSLLE